MRIVVVVATHKRYWVANDELYLPIQAGASLHERLPYTGDDSGDNISKKNRNYCELTALYWAWKNLDSEYVGLCHYRRYFAAYQCGPKRKRILTAEQAKKLLEKANVILPKKRNYWIETNYSQYIHAHHKEDLDITRQVLLDRWPDYIPAFDNYMSQTKGHHFNMLIMRRDLLCGYCSWLFDVLAEVEKRIDISSYTPKDQRVFGYISERLVDTWMDTNHVDYIECSTVNLERQNWIKKGSRFLLRKFFAKE